ncbi:MAG: glycosyltransferase family 2 protein [Motilibacteraceae bacterium]
MVHQPVTVAVQVGNDPAATRSMLDAVLGQLGVRDELILLCPQNERTTPWRSSRARIVVFDGSGPDAATRAALEAAQHDRVLVTCDDVIFSHRLVERLAHALDSDPALVAVGPLAPHVNGIQRVDLPDDVAGDLRALRRWMSEVGRGAGDSVLPARRLDPVCLLLRREGASLTAPGLGPVGSLAVVPGAVVAHLESEGCARALAADDPLLSLCMIVKDEEASILDTIESARRIVDEVIVYDTGSRDRTRDLAREAGAHVVEGFWNNHFAEARNRAAEHVRTPWMLVLDADETLTVDNPAALRAFLRRTTCDALLVGVRNTHDLGGVSLENWSVRVMRPMAARYVNPLHEQVVHSMTGEQIDLLQTRYDDLRVEHVGYRRQRMEDRDKTRRNYEIAISGLAAARTSGSVGVLMDALVNAGRSATGTEQLCREALTFLEEAWKHFTETNQYSGTASLGAYTAAMHSIVLGEMEAAATWRDRFRRASGNESEAVVIDANIAARSGETQRAIELLESLPETYLGSMGRLTPRAHLLPTVLGWRLSCGLPTEVTVREMVRGDVPLVDLDLLLSAFDGSSSALAEVLTSTPAPTLLRSVCGQAISHPQGGELLRSLHEAAPTELAPVAAAANLPANDLSLEAAVYWSLALRAVGHAEECPLRKIRDGDQPSRAAVACAVLADACSDEESWKLLPEKLGDVPSEDEHEVVGLLQTFAPRVADAVVSA